MTRMTVIVGLAAIVAIGLAGGLTLISSNDPTPSQKQSTRSPTDERAPEAENHSTQGLDVAEADARRFLTGYLALVYGKSGATIDKLRNVSPSLLGSLRSDSARVTPAQAQRTPRLVRVAVIRQGAAEALATAQIKDSAGPAYPLILHMQDTTDGWIVTRLGGP